MIRENESNEEKKAYEKLYRKIARLFDKCRYIGDIPINDEEYALLKKHLQNICRNYLSTTENYTDNPMFAVALVQIGMRYYDGRFWPHVEKETGLTLPGQYQKRIGRSFYYTLKKHKKYVVAENEMMNNILLHCFITEHYSGDLFDFLFAYYQIDLERDLSRNSRDMRDYLMQSMLKGENTARAYKIKKHTSDAVSANERGCRIRVGKILRLMDNALFEDILPTASQNRIAQMFCKWVETSKYFSNSKKELAGLTKKGEKRFSKPYLRFDSKQKLFRIVLPRQYIHLSSDEEVPEPVWRITYAGITQTVTAYAESCVTGCKTKRNDDIIIPAEKIFRKITLELLKNSNEKVNNFYIPAGSIRFFDYDCDQINYNEHLPDGNIYAFVQKGDVLVSYPDSSVLCCKQISGLVLYDLYLSKGDILRLPDGKAISVGKTLEEGLVGASLPGAAYAAPDGEKSAIYSAVPSLYFKMEQAKENGTLIRINGPRYRLDMEKCIKCGAKDKTYENGYILKLSDYISDDGIYRIEIDVPRSKKVRDYTFVLINSFSFEFENAPYVFKETGVIRFNGSRVISGNQLTEKSDSGTFEFDIPPDSNYLSFSVKTKNSSLPVRIYIPAFKWKFDEGEWHTDKPESIWHADFPKFIYFKFPDDAAAVTMPPIIADDCEDEEGKYSESLARSKENHMFICDTRKIISWFGYEEAKRPLSVRFNSYGNIRFADIITRCFIADDKIEITADRKNKQLWFKCLVKGFSDCAADVYRDGELIAEKVTMRANGVKLNIPFISAVYRIDFFETNEEDDFGYTDYRKFDSKTCTYINKRDLTGKTLIIKSFAENKPKSTLFSAGVYEFAAEYCISNIRFSAENPDKYCGLLSADNSKKINVTFCFCDDKDIMNKAYIFFRDEEYDEDTAFLYDKKSHRLAVTQDKNLTTSQAKTRYIAIFDDQFHYNVQVK